MSAPVLERASRASARPSGRSGRRSRGTLAAVLVLALIAVPGFALWRVIADATTHDRRESDAIIVLGAAQYDGRPSPVFAARLSHARSLYQDSVAPRIITVGGKQPGDRHTEAGAGVDYLIRTGVPTADISAVPTGRDTIQSLEAVAKVAKREGWNEVTLVSDPAHMARVDAIARQLGFTTHLNATRRGDGSTLTAHYVARETAGWLAFATVQRWSTPRPLR